MHLTPPRNAISEPEQFVVQNALDDLAAVLDEDLVGVADRRMFSSRPPFLDLTFCHRMKELGHWLGKRRPLAASFYDAIAAGRGFQRLAAITDVQPGDVIAFKYPPGSHEGDDTGHVMLVAGAPSQCTYSAVPATR